MKEKAGTEEAPKDKVNPITEMSEQALKSCEEAMKNGLKWQQETGKWWSSWLSQTTSAEDWQKRVTGLTTLMADFMPAAQKRTDEVLDLAEKNSRTGVDLVKKAVDAAQAPGLADSQAKWTEWWTASLGAVRANSETLALIHGRAIDSWIEFMQKSNELSPFRSPKAV